MSACVHCFDVQLGINLCRSRHRGVFVEKCFGGSRFAPESLEADFSVTALPFQRRSCGAAKKDRGFKSHSIEQDFSGKVSGDNTLTVNREDTPV